MVLPNIEVDNDVKTQKYGRFNIGPMESGYGLTLGTALRRVLLSSLPGHAVVSLRVSGVAHEFTVIPHAREDMTRLILNCKQLRLKMIDCETARLRLEVHGEGVVTAADLQAPPEVEIVNPDLYLLTLDSDDAQFEMELSVEEGVGYSPAGERGHLPIGEIPVDAIFSPVGNVDFKAGAYRLLSSQVHFYNDEGTHDSTVSDRLYFNTLPAHADNATAIYTFIALAPEDTRLCSYTGVG